MTSGTMAIGNYINELKRFSRNARLFLYYSLLSGLGTGIWNVMFNLYLLRLGYEMTFVGLFWMVDMLFHGGFAFPAGLIGDKIGRRKAFILATTLNILARGVLLFVRDPAMLIVLAAVAGMGEGFHAVAGAPFMMENSEPRERPHLFSVNSSFMMISQFVGSLSGGFLPLMWSGLLQVPAIDPAAARWALVVSLPLTFVALIPLAVIREKKIALVESFRDLFTLRNVVNYGVIFKLALCSLLVGLAFGMATRFFNVFFSLAHRVTDEQVGLYLAIGSLGSAGSILMSPYMNRRWGMAKGTMVSQLLSVPFLFLMAAVSSLPLVVVFFIMRGAVYSISMPLREQLSMAFLVSKERATGAGLIHMGFDLGGAAGAMTAGGLMTGGEFLVAFSVAAGLIIFPAVLYPIFFAKMEASRRAGK